MALLFELKQKLVLGFQGFWARWPRKVAKVEAEKEWNKINPDPALEETIHAALDWQIPIFQTREPEYIPHARKWLHHRRWEDERPTTTPNRVTGKPRSSAQRSQQEAIAQIQRLIHHGMEPEAAKRKVYLEMGWIKEGPPSPPSSASGRRS